MCVCAPTPKITHTENPLNDDNDASTHQPTTIHYIPASTPKLQVTAKLKPRKGHEEEEDPLPFLFMTSHFESLADPVHAKERCVRG